MIGDYISAFANLATSRDPTYDIWPTGKKVNGLDACCIDTNGV